MKHLFFLAACILPLQANPVAGQGSDLKADPKAVFGSLDNGMNYIIYPNAEPPGRFSTRLHIAAGSLMEADDQRGVAHFLEHMVFNGSRNFTSAELIPKMQRLGIAFGAHANAYTSFDETVYMLDLPNMDQETVNLTFTVMRDFADGALLKEDEIDKERGVIISEKSSRDSVGYRMMLKQFEYLLPESRLMQRVPIGIEKVINSAPRERFTDFYSRYYTPERMTFVVVGDFDVKEMETRVRETFISLENPEKLGDDPAVDTAPSGFGLRSEVFVDQEITSDDITLYALRDYTPKPDTKASRLETYPLSVAHSILNRRFEILAKKEGSPILAGGGGRNIYFNMIESGSLAVSPGEGKWKEAIPVLEQEFRRALLHGFTQGEINEVTANLINSAEQAVKRAPTRESDGIAMAFVNATNSRNVFTTPQTSLAITKEAVAALSPVKIHEAFKNFWSGDDRSLVLTTAESKKGIAEELKQLFLESQKTEVAAPKQEETAAFGYSELGTPGSITSETKDDDFEVTQMTLSNGVKVNYKKTDFKKNSISMVARFGNGTFTMPKDLPGLDQFSSMTFSAGGLGKHSNDDLERILAGKNVGVGFGVGDDAFSLSGRTTPDDLELQLQLMVANLTDPGFRPEAERQVKMMIPMIYNQLAHTMQGAQVEMSRQLHGGDYRFSFPGQEKATTYSTEMIKSWLMPEFKDSSLELSIVGDFDPEKLRPLILKTFGAIPSRKSSKPDFNELKKIYMPARPGNGRITFDSKDPSGAAVAIWKIPAVGDDIQTARRFNLLSDILSDRMREEIREKLGGSYSPRAGSSASPTLDIGFLQATAKVKPEEVEKYGKLMIQLADQMATKGITQDELERALKPIQSNLKESLRSNGYWLSSVLSGSQEKPNKIKWAKGRDADYASITVEELNALAKEHLHKENSLRYELVPEAK
ncbi:insulinase family protein [Akkermansiaceae bacterium]|nr:insulinase family protein [Akkermansiaceae bacterium]MDB4419271.1 insulinase family protein [bacterium]